MGKYKHEGKGRNISVGGGQERKDLFKDMSGGYNAMGDSNSPNYQYNGSAFKQRYSSPMEKYGPLHGNAFGHAMQKAGGDYDKAKSMLEMKGSPMYQGKDSRKSYDTMRGSSDKRYAELMGEAKSITAPSQPPRENFEQMVKLRKPLEPANLDHYLDKNKIKTPLYKSGCTSGGSSKSPYKQMGDPNKKMDRLSAKHKSLYDRFEMGQTSEAEEQRMYRLEDRMDKVGKKIKKSKKSPLNQGTSVYGKRHDRLRKKGKELDEKSFNQPEKKVRKSDRQYLRSRKKLDKAREIRKNNK